MKKTILHLITSLGRGGAETMLVNVIRELNDYRNIVVTLNKENHFEEELHCDLFICLDYPSLLSFPLASVKIRQLIKKHKVDMVHSHLPQANFVARLGTPAPIPLVTTIHTSIADAIGYQKGYIRLLDRLTYSFKSSTIIAVSRVALDNYFSVLKLKPHQAYIVYTFVDITVFHPEQRQTTGNIFRMISVGALRRGKNYRYLLNALDKMKGYDIQLDIYGTGPMQVELQEAIDKMKLNVSLKGQVKKVNEVLPHYDLFVMPSLFEGFSLSVLEAMATKIPLLVSDIPSFREQCGDCAEYFDLADPGDFIIKLERLLANKGLLSVMADKALERVHNNFTLEHHMKGLRKIYEQVIGS